MTSTLANVIQSVLRGLGLRTINLQFFFSYSLIFLCAALTAGVLFMSSKDASQIDMAGAQRAQPEDDERGAARCAGHR